MDISPEEMATKNGNLDEPELQELARSYDSLTGPAQDALRAAFARRNLTPDSIGETNDSPVHRQFVTVRRYRDLSEAIVARSLLESAGISVYLRDENLIRLDWPMSNVIGGIRLQVDASDDLSASEFLAQPIPDTIPFDGSAEYSQPRCPRCQSTDITFEGSSRKAALAGLYIASLPLPLGSKMWLCGNCRFRWEDGEE